MILKQISTAVESIKNNTLLAKATNKYRNLPALIQNFVIGGIAFPILFTGYLVINYMVPVGKVHYLTTEFDNMVPFIPETIYIYAWVFVFLFLPVFVVKDRKLFSRTLSAYMFLHIIAFIFFVAFPVEYNRPALTKPVDFLSWAVGFNYWLDKPMNCFPSLHVANAFLAVFISFKANKKVAYIALFGAILISISTLTMKQHYVLDVAAGLALALITERLFFRNLNLTDEPELSFHPILSLAVVGIYLAMIISFVFLYSIGFEIDMTGIS